MNKSIIAEKRALSPVIATVILISVTIVVAVSVAYWMGSIASGYTSFEQIELPTTYAKAISSPFTGWNVTIELKNTGSADATIDNIFINSIPLKDYTSGIRLYANGNNETSNLSNLAISVNKGGSATLVIQLEQSTSNGFTSVSYTHLTLPTN